MGTDDRDAENQDHTIVREDTWFRKVGKSLWHAQAHREYGVLWSTCGIRAVAAEVETSTVPAEGETLCPKCEGRVR